MVEQPGGGHQGAAVEVADADVCAVTVVVVAVEAVFGAFELGVELGAEYAVAQGLGLAQGAGAVQALGLQAASGDGFAGNGGLGHAWASLGRRRGLRPLGFAVQAQARKARCHPVTGA